MTAAGTLLSFFVGFISLAPVVPIFFTIIVMLGSGMALVDYGFVKYRC